MFFFKKYQLNLIKITRNMSSLSPDHINNLKQIFLAGVNAVKPHTIFQQDKCLNLHKNKLIVKTDDQTTDEFDIGDKKIHIVGFGKAMLGLAFEIENVLKERLTSGIMSVPHGSMAMLQQNSNAMLLQKETLSCSKIRIYEGAENNLPDESAFNASKEIVQLCHNLTKQDILLCLISGGGSALLPYPKPPITLEEKTNIIKLLSKKGATINELNTVRIAMSLTKGGKLAEIAQNTSQIISLIISDIIHDPLELIASGPTVVPTILDDPMEILRKYDIKSRVTKNALQVIENYSPVKELSNVKNYVIANNQVSINAAIGEAKLLGYDSIFLSKSINGDVNDVMGLYENLTQKILKKSCTYEVDDKFFNSKFMETLMRSIDVLERNPKSSKGICFVAGGEPTVHVTGKGIGGRNQELGLKFTEFCLKNTIKNMMLLSAGTDGIDGPTDAAGAIGGYMQSNLDLIKQHLHENNSYYFYKNHASNCHVNTGHTGTNVMDLQILLYTPYNVKSSL